MGPSLATLTPLTQLNLGKNYFRDKGAAALAPHLAMLTAVKAAGLIQTYIGDEGMRDLVAYLTRLTRLEALKLDRCYNSEAFNQDGGATLLVEALASILEPL